MQMSLRVWTNEINNETFNLVGSSTKAYEHMRVLFLFSLLSFLSLSLYPSLPLSLSLSFFSLSLSLLLEPGLFEPLGKKRHVKFPSSISCVSIFLASWVSDPFQHPSFGRVGATNSQTAGLGGGIGFLRSQSASLWVVSCHLVVDLCAVLPAKPCDKSFRLTDPFEVVLHRQTAGMVVIRHQDTPGIRMIACVKGDIFKEHLIQDHPFRCFRCFSTIFK